MSNEKDKLQMKLDPNTMANTYTQIHIHAVFAVQGRACVIKDAWKDELYKYISGIITNNGHKLLIINGMPDHLHLLFGMRPVQSLSELMQDIKRSSSIWINSRNLVMGRFSWQEGFGAFSYSKSQINKVMFYIRNQELHHNKINFREEYMIILNSFGVEYNVNYIFKPVDY
jgi:REP element-mobilizing transposase RayT